MGVVISVVFTAYSAPIYKTRDWITLLSNDVEARRILAKLDEKVVKKLSSESSMDFYLYWNAGQLHLGVTVIQAQTNGVNLETFDPFFNDGIICLGLRCNDRFVNGVDLFEREMYISRMYGGHGGGKTSMFKRCVFLRNTGAMSVIDALLAAIHDGPSHICYLHLLQGGGAVAEVAVDATALAVETGTLPAP